MTTVGIAEPAYGFGRFRALPRSRMLVADGAPVELGNRAFDVLMALIEARGALVTKDELLNRVWPGTIAEESNLHVQISALRKALGDDRSIILTVSGRGYRFTVPVSFAAGTAEAPAIADGEQPLPATNLPAMVTELVGRDGALDELLELTRAHRLVTVVGAGGIGKTRLALEAARRLLPDFGDGAWLAELAPLASPSSVPATIAAAVGLELGEEPTPLRRVAAALRGKRLLLILDNCEHVIDAVAAAVEPLLHGSSTLHLLATSQQPLGVEGECTYRLAPLEVPAALAGTGDEAVEPGAVRLFVARARAADPHFQLNRQTGPAVAAICRHLDGMPLAIELAAARVAALGVEELARRLDDRFRLLAGGRRTALPRHQTLRAALDWSYGLLSAPEQVVLRRLAIFAGGFALDGAGAVAATGTISPDEVTEHVLDLVGRSLVAVDTAGPVPRYRLLETTRLYALEKLANSGEFDAVAASHALYARNVAEQAEAMAKTLPGRQWLTVYGPEIDNLRQAIDWALGPAGDRLLGLELTAVAGMMWSLTSLTGEGRVRVERALAAVDADTPRRIEARLWRNAGLLQAGRPKAALPALDRAIALYRALDEPLELARSLEQLGQTLSLVGRAEAAEAALAEADALLAAAGDRGTSARNPMSLGIVRMFAGRLQEARSQLAEAVAGSGADAADYWSVRALINLAYVEFCLDEVEQAVAHGRQAVALCRSQHWTSLIGQALCRLAGYLIETGETAAAVAALREGLPLARERDNGSIIVALGLYCMAAVALDEARLERSASCFGYAEAFFVQEFGKDNPFDRRYIKRLRSRLDEALAPEVLAHLKAAGAAWSEEQAVREALAS